MAQFTVYENTNKYTNNTIPYLVDIQSELLDGLSTRVVAPMCPSSAIGKPISNLSPTFEINGSLYVLLTSQLAGIPLHELGPSVCDLSEYRSQFINALDLLFTGI